MEKKTTLKPTEQGQKYSIPQLQKNAYELFGVSSSTFAGATLDLDGEYTVDEVKKIISDWKKKEVK